MRKSPILFFPNLPFYFFNGICITVSLLLPPLAQTEYEAFHSSLHSRPHRPPRQTDHQQDAPYRLISLRLCGCASLASKHQLLNKPIRYNAGVCTSPLTTLDRPIVAFSVEGGLSRVHLKIYPGNNSFSTRRKLLLI